MTESWPRCSLCRAWQLTASRPDSWQGQCDLQDPVRSARPVMKCWQGEKWRLAGGCWGVRGGQRPIHHPLSLDAAQHFAELAEQN